MVPTTMRCASRPSGDGADDAAAGRARIIARISARKNVRIAASVPRWRATSNARPNSGGVSQPKNSRARIR
jgi:hypothetical protein